MGGSLAVIVSATLDEPNRRVSVVRTEGAKQLSELRSLTERPQLTARPQELVLGERGLRAVLLLPSGHTPGTRLPVLLDPYGGPHAPLVVASHHRFPSPQWFSRPGLAGPVAGRRGT